MKKEQISDILFLGEKIQFKESPPSIMVTRNPNWSTKILMVRDWLHEKDAITP